MAGRLTTVATALIACLALVSAQDAAASTAPVAASACTLEATGGTVTRTLGARSYELHVPPGLGGAEVPLLLSLHGFGSNGSQDESFTGWSGFAGERGFIVAYPNGRGLPGSGAWDPYTPASPDVAFLREVVADVSARWCVDPDRVHVDGWSNGAVMSQRAACEAPGTFASVTSYGGGTPAPPLATPCSPTRPISVGLFVGQFDFTFAGLAQNTDEWIGYDDCSPTPVSTTDPHGTLDRYSCAAGTEVLARVVSNTSHDWPRGARGQDQRARMWAFFEAHPRPASTAATAVASRKRGKRGKRRTRTWYVSADAKPRGTGSRRAPLRSLARVERVSRRGDSIVVLPARGTLDGGIALKRRQRLTGAGRSVRSRSQRRRAPLLANTDPARHDGDAVRLADGVTVSNLRIVGSHRGGIYGRNVRGVRIAGNEVSGHNTSCTPGFHIPPFNVPTTAPGVGVPISEGLHNGWAGIMLDADRRRGRVAVLRNRVHDADCGDGIDVRLSGGASYRARVERNLVEDLRQGEDFESLLAIGLQTRDRSRLVARIARNRQTDLGNEGPLETGPEGADSEGVFINPVGGSRMDVTVTHNAYTNPRGLGGFSGNGLEYVTMGDGSRSRVEVRDSSFTNATGDIVEQLALSTNAHMTLVLENVTAVRSLGLGNSGFGNTVVIPGNNGDCLLAASGGAGNVIDTTVRGSELSDCANNGVTFGSAVANGEGPTSRMRLDVSGSRITGNRGANLRVGNETALDELSVKVEDTDLSDSRGTGSGVANAAFEDLGTTARSTIDLGGGALGSAGGNCLAGGALAADLVRYDVTAERNWWGPAGPIPGRVVAAGGALDAAPSLAAPPARCDR